MTSLTRVVAVLLCCALLTSCGRRHHADSVVPDTSSAQQSQRAVLSVQGPDGNTYKRKCANGNANCYVICDSAAECAAAGYPGYDNVSITFYSGASYSYSTGGAAGYYQGGVHGTPYNCFPSTNPACLQGRSAPYNPPTRIKIFTAAHNYENTNTRALFGTGDACSYAVSAILKQVFPDFPITANVENLVDLMRAFGAVVVSPSEAGPGDVAVQGLDPTTLKQVPAPDGGDNHVGICVDGGCATVLSNGTTPGTFATLSGPTFSNLSAKYLPTYPYTIFHFP
jgi:hypothetical protein